TTASSEGFATEWVRAVQFGDERAALVEFATPPDASVRPLTARMGREPSVMAIGTTDPSWVIIRVSNDIAALVGEPADEILGRSFLGGVEQRDVDRLLEADRRAREECSVSL